MTELKIPGPASPKKRVVDLALLSALVVVVTLVVCQRRVMTSRFTDQGHLVKYTAFSDDIAAGRVPATRLNDVSPLYLVVTTIWARTGLAWKTLQTTQLAAVGLAALLLGLTAARFGGPVAAAGAAAVMLFSRTAYLNATEFEPETLILLLNAIGLFLLIRPERPRLFSSLVPGVLALAVSATARPTVLPAAILLVLPIIFSPPDAPLRRRVGFLAVAALTLVLPIIGAATVLRAVAGQSIVMDPGTIFYEGLSPNTTGYPFAPPPIVADVCSTLHVTDPLHVAYRDVASAVEGHALRPEEANRYWVTASLRFARAYPWVAARLAATKLFLALHSYDAWDLSPMVTKTAQMPSWPWIPFGLAIAAGVLAAGRRDWRARAFVPLAGFVAGYLAVFAIFYVSGRQRNAIIPSVALLAGLGAATLWDLVRRRRSRPALAAALLVILATVVLTRDYSWQTEDRYYWTAIARSKALSRAATEAARQGDGAAAERYRANKETWLVLNDPYVPEVSPGALRAAALAQLGKAWTDPRLFDIAFALEKAGAWKDADQVLRGLEDTDYSPHRRYATVNSVAYYRARALFHLNRRDEALVLLDRAAREAPGNADVLALRAVATPSTKDLHLLDAIHDRFTAQLALAHAELDLGRVARAAALADEVSREFPEWDRARILSSYLDDVIARARTR